MNYPYQHYKSLTVEAVSAALEEEEDDAETWKDGHNLITLEHWPLEEALDEEYFS